MSANNIIMNAIQIIVFIIILEGVKRTLKNDYDKRKLEQESYFLVPGQLQREQDRWEAGIDIVRFFLVLYLLWIILPLDYLYGWAAKFFQ